MKQQTIPAKITSITLKVEVTGYSLEKPDRRSYIDPDKPYDFWRDAYKYALKKYEASKFTAEAENVEKAPSDRWIIRCNIGDSDIDTTNYLEVGQFCQIIETREGKCKIVELK